MDDKTHRKWLMLIHADLEMLIGEAKLSYSMLFFFSLFLVLLTINLIAITSNNSGQITFWIVLLFVAMAWFLMTSKNRREGGIMVEKAKKDIEELRKELGLKEEQKQQTNQ